MFEWLYPVHNLSDKMRRATKARIIGYSVTAFVAYLFYWTNIQRTGAGYFEDPFWITITQMVDIVLFALLTGIVLGEFLNKIKNKR